MGSPIIFWPIVYDRETGLQSHRFSGVSNRAYRVYTQDRAERYDFDHDFGYYLPLFSSLLKKRGEKKKMKGINRDQKSSLSARS